MRDIIQRRLALALLGAVAAIVPVAGAAQVPPDLAAANRAIGKGNDQPTTAKLYAPLAEKPPFREAMITRDLSYGPYPENLLDVFAPVTSGKHRPVLIYVSGGMGTRVSGDKGVPNGDAFYQNIMLWAVKQGLVAINTDRRQWRKHPWETGPTDIAATISWVGQILPASAAIRIASFFSATASVGRNSPPIWRIANSGWVSRPA